MKLRHLALVGTLALVGAQTALAQSGVPRKPCIGPDAPSGCSALPSGPKTVTESAQPSPERRQALVRVPLNEPTPPPEPEGSVTVNPATPDAEATLQDAEEQIPR